MHRSAYEYLLENEDFNEICLRLAVTKLDCYNLHIRGWLRRITIDPLIPPVQSTLMQYAHAIELLSQKHQAVVMHQIRKAVVFADRVSWDGGFNNFFDDRSFFNSCASHGLQHFITHTFDFGEHLAYDVDSNGISFAALQSLNEDLGDTQKGRGPDDPKELAERMAEFRNIAITMLRHGASPNDNYDMSELDEDESQCPAPSPWRYFLFVMWKAFWEWVHWTKPPISSSWERSRPFDVQTFGEVAEAFLERRPCLDTNLLKPSRFADDSSLPILLMKNSPSSLPGLRFTVQYSPIKLLVDCLHQYTSINQLEATALAQGARSIRKPGIWRLDRNPFDLPGQLKLCEDEERVLNQELDVILAAETGRQRMTAASIMVKELCAIRARHEERSSLLFLG